MMQVVEWFIRVSSEGLTEQERKKFAALLWRLFLLWFVLWSFGLLGPNSGFAKARDIEHQIAEAVEPILEELTKIRKEMEKDNETQRQQLVEGVILRIREMQKVCMSLPPDTAARNRMAILIENAQLEYEALTATDDRPGQRYPVTQICD